MSEYDRLKAMKDRIVEEKRPLSNFEKVGQFNDACDCHREPEIGMPPAEVVRMRLALITEELDELVDACAAGDIVEIADALADLEYVVLGAGHTFGLPSQAVFDEVHRSNMAKVGPGGKVIKREDGKILKPAHWTPPDVAGVLAKHGYDVPDRCEGCDKPATMQDSEGVPLCKECYESLDRDEEIDLSEGDE